MKKSDLLFFRGIKENAEVQLPGSKSESNRLLILQALYPNQIHIRHLSEANDTLLLQSALQSRDEEVNIEDAGTAMRFLTAYFAYKNDYKRIIGSPRMCERPIGILADALNAIGFDIRYEKNVGYPPLAIHPIKWHALKKEVSIAGNVSSQYISALLLIASSLPNGLTIQFTTPLTSLPYIHLTTHTLAKVGIIANFSPQQITVLPQTATTSHITVERDWSAASYFYAIAALIPSAAILLENLNLNDKQGDAAMAKFAEKFGVYSTQTATGVLIKNVGRRQSNDYFFDMADTPDLAQTLIPLCAILNIPARFCGLKTLRIKETDRIAALRHELAQFDIKLTETESNMFQLEGVFTIPEKPFIQTYSDHRMAMGFAPYAFRFPIEIEDPGVVKKSFPKFWEEVYKIAL